MSWWVNFFVWHNSNQSLPGCLSLSGNVLSSLNAPPGLPQVIILTYKQDRILNGHLHEEAWAESLPDVHVIVLWCEVCARPLQVEPRKRILNKPIILITNFSLQTIEIPVHDSAQLLSHIVRRLQTSVVHKVVVAPLKLKALSKRVLHIQFRTGIVWQST